MAGALAGRRRPGHRDLPARARGRPVHGAPRRSGDGFWPTRCRSARSTWTSSGRRASTISSPQTGGRRIVLSMHDFDGGARRPVRSRAGDARDRRRGRESRRHDQVAPRLRHASSNLGAESGLQRASCVIGMGDPGPDHARARRRASARRGPTRADCASVGQVSGADPPHRLSLPLADRHRRTSTASSGGSVAHSVSPAMHNAAFRAAHLDAVYLPFPTA